jgi:uncharacterized protein (TIGR02186 family)
LFSSAALTARTNHDHITVDLFYHGSEVSVRGISDPGVDLVVKLESPEIHQSMKKKDKVGGLLWMNTGDENFGNVPDLYFIQSTRPLADMLPLDEREKYVIGFDALEKHADVEPAKDENEKDKWFSEFIRFKQNSMLYLAKDGGFDLNDQDGNQSYYMKFDWPYQAKPGDYLVTVYAVKDGKVLETATAKVDVEQVGAVKTLAGMAKNNGALYGGVSILVALMAGFGVGLVFKGGGAH